MDDQTNKSEEQPIYPEPVKGSLTNKSLRQAVTYKDPVGPKERIDLQTLIIIVGAVLAILLFVVAIISYGGGRS